MKVKLNQGMAGDRFSFRPNQVITCSAASGARLITHGIAKEVSDATEADGELFDVHAEEKLKPAKPAKPETATKPKPKTPESTGLKCQGATKAGNPCMNAAVAGSTFCAKHAEG